MARTTEFRQIYVKIITITVIYAIFALMLLRMED